MIGVHTMDLLDVTPAAVAQIMDRYDFAVTGWEAPPAGIENLTLIVASGAQRRILRVYRQAARTDAQVALELDFMDAARRRGLPVPRVMPTVDGEEFAVVQIAGGRWQCVLMEFVSGAQPALYTPGLLENMAGLQASMHHVGVEYAACHGISAERRPLRADVSESVPRCEFFARAASFTVELAGVGPLGMCHLDYDCDNVLAEGDEVSAILDFGDLACQPVVVCLGNTLWDVAFEPGGSADAVAEYLKAYERVRPLGPRERDLLPQIILVRHYVIAVVEQQLGLLTDEGVTRAIARDHCLLTRIRPSAVPI
jgi:Ser/Thr protein kinase RdoA (MazF antagonist)